MMNTAPSYQIAMPCARHRVDGALENLLQMAALIAALVLSAHARVYLPLSPVPVTLQTLVVLVAGPLLGWRKATAAILGYLLLGLAGAPVFTASASLSAGYLAAFLTAPWIVSRFHSPAGGMAAALGFIYALGAGWLGLVLGLEPLEAFWLGVVPFLAGDAAKLVAAAAFASRLTR